MTDKDFSESDILEMIDKIAKDGNFPNNSFDIRRHLHRIESIEKIQGGKARFSIERHPHLFGKRSVGRASSAFCTTTDQYELDLNSKTIEFVCSSGNEISIDYQMLAREEVESLFENISDQYREDFAKFSTEEEVIDYADEQFNLLDWEDFFISDYKLPDDFFEEIMEELQDEFTTEMINLWYNYQDDREE